MSAPWRLAAVDQTVVRRNNAGCETPEPTLAEEQDSPDAEATALDAPNQ
jgi:hypothetical protein